jgi:uncharacterized membrane protein YbhN (UPF0104 family)
MGVRLTEFLAALNAYPWTALFVAFFLLSLAAVLRGHA